MHRADRLDLGAAGVEIGLFLLDAQPHLLDDAGILAAQAVQLLHLLDDVTGAGSHQSSGILPQGLDALAHGGLQDLAALADQAHTQRLFQLGQPAGLEQLVVPVDLGQQALLGRDRQHLRRRDTEHVGRIAALGGDLQLNLFGRAELVPHGVDLVEHHQPRFGRVAQGTEVLAPDGQVRLGHAGVGRQDEHHGMRLGQEAHRQLGLGADRIQAGGIQNHQALLEQGVRHVDERMAPFGHLDQAVGPQRRVVIGQLVVPEPEGTRLVLGDTPDLGHFLDGLGQLLGIVDVQIDPLPLAWRIAPVQQGLRLQAGFDGKQADAGGHLGVVAQLGRAHGGAPCTGRHDPAPVAGKEHRVDQFRLAARELGHERHHDPVILDLGMQLVKTLADGRIHQVVVIEPLGQQLQAQRKLLAPGAVFVQFLIECHGVSFPLPVNIASRPCKALAVNALTASGSSGSSRSTAAPDVSGGWRCRRRGRAARPGRTPWHRAGSSHFAPRHC